MIADHKCSVFIESKTVSMSLVTLMYRHRVPRGGSDEKKDREGERLETERKIAINFSGGAFLFSPRHIVPIYIYIYTLCGIPLSRGIRAGEERRGKARKKFEGAAVIVAGSPPNSAGDRETSFRGASVQRPAKKKKNPPAAW